jgi:hypothetical protein
VELTAFMAVPYTSAKLLILEERPNLPIYRSTPRYLITSKWQRFAARAHGVSDHSTPPFLATVFDRELSVPVLGLFLLVVAVSDRAQEEIFHQF